MQITIMYLINKIIWYKFGKGLDIRSDSSQDPIVEMHLMRDSKVSGLIKLHPIHL